MELSLLHKNVITSSHRKGSLVALITVYQFELWLKVQRYAQQIIITQAWAMKPGLSWASFRVIRGRVNRVSLKFVDQIPWQIMRPIKTVWLQSLIKTIWQPIYLNRCETSQGTDTNIWWSLDAHQISKQPPEYTCTMPRQPSFVALFFFTEIIRIVRKWGFYSVKLMPTDSQLHWGTVSPSHADILCILNSHL